MHIYVAQLDDQSTKGGSNETKIMTSLCSGREELNTTKYKQDNKVQFVYQAVYAVAHALKRLLDEECGKTKGRGPRLKCMKTTRINGERLYNLLLNTSFEGKMSV